MNNTNHDVILNAVQCLTFLSLVETNLHDNGNSKVHEVILNAVQCLTFISLVETDLHNDGNSKVVSE